MTTNADIQVAISNIGKAYEQEAHQEQIDEINSWLWHATLLSLVALGVFFLWRIARRTQHKSKASDSPSDKPTDPTPKVRQPVASKHPTTKPPTLDSPAQLSPTPPATTPTAPADSSKHPHARYMPPDHPDRH